MKETSASRNEVIQPLPLSWEGAESELNPRPVLTDLKLQASSPKPSGMHKGGAQVHSTAPTCQFGSHSLSKERLGYGQEKMCRMCIRSWD